MIWEWPGRLNEEIKKQGCISNGREPGHAKINEALHRVKLETPAGIVSFTPQGLGIGDLYIAQSVVLADRVDWKPIDKYSQVVLDMPGAAPSK